MAMNRKINAISTVEYLDNKVSAEDLAKSQWALIRKLEDQYIGKPVHGTNCKFEDDRWFSLDSLSANSRYGVNWQAHDNGEPALQILIKSFLFDAISERRIETGTAEGKYRSIRNWFIPLIESKNLLTGKVGGVLLGLNHLTDVDLMQTLDTILVSQTFSKEKATNTCRDIEAFYNFANHISEQVPVYRVRANLPWQKSGESIYEWVEKRATDLDLMFREINGFEPLHSETIQPLVENSLTLIDQYFDHFAAIAPVVARYDFNVKHEKGSAKRLLQKYEPIFSRIIAAPDLSEKLGTKEKTRCVIMWLRSLLYLARGACVNVILLTSGLRNTDVRGLQIATCKPSKRNDMLFYLRTYIHKTKNTIDIPVPGQAEKAFRLLEKIKFTDSPYLLDACVYASDISPPSTSNVTDDTEEDQWIKHGVQLNNMLRNFAEHFNIPFVSPTTGVQYSAHCYRTTVAGWLGSASNLSILLVRRLFGHSNNVMPTVYLNNNPAFVAEREAQKALAHAETARQMGLAASQGRLAGIKGEQMLRGYQAHKSRMEEEMQTSHSLTDVEVVRTFNQILEERINSGSVCAFLTPFGVQCMRNPSDTSQPPCAKRANRDKTQDIAPELLKHVSDINPQQCIGTSCTDAVLGPWSTSVLETLNWYRALLSHQLGDAFTEEHFIESAKQFIQQYKEPLRKVFGIAAMPNEPESTSIREKVVQKNV